jgi:hypothetical protein
LTLLAGLAFLAFLLQTLHALLYRQTTSVSSVGLSRKISDSPSELEHTVKSALDKYVSILNILLNADDQIITQNNVNGFRSQKMEITNLEILSFKMECHKRTSC